MQPEPKWYWRLFWMQREQRSYWRDEKGRWMVPASVVELVGYFFLNCFCLFVCLCMSALCASCLHTACVAMLKKARRGRRIPWSWCCSWYWAAMGVLWIEPLGRPTSALCHLSSPSSSFSLGFPWLSVSLGITILLFIGIETHLSPLSP